MPNVDWPNPVDATVDPPPNIEAVDGCVALPNEEPPNNDPVDCEAVCPKGEVCATVAVFGAPNRLVLPVEPNVDVCSVVDPPPPPPNIDFEEPNAFAALPNTLPAEPPKIFDVVVEVDEPNAFDVGVPNVFVVACGVPKAFDVGVAPNGVDPNGVDGVVAAAFPPNIEFAFCCPNG